MSPTTETIAKNLGSLRKGLIKEGFKEDEAFQITLDLIRRGSDIPAVVQPGE